MNFLQQNSQVKVKQEVSDEKDQLDNYKCESQPLTEPDDEVKVKIETKVSCQKKQEPTKDREETLPEASFTSQNQQNEPRNIAFKRNRRNLSQYERIEDVRSVASHFIEYGLNFRKFSETYPEIDAKFYRNTVEAINNTAINQIEKYLRYECNIQIEKLNRDQKRSIRTQLTKVRQWLGKKDMSQLRTLYKFIQRKYELLNVEISIEEGLKFYKTILQIVKSPYVDVMEDDIKPERFDPQISMQVQIQEKQMQQKTLTLLYIQHRNISKVSDLLCEKFGYTLKWSKMAVKNKIARMIKTSLKKIIASVEAYDSSLSLYFSESDECVMKICKNEEGDNSMNMKIFLLEFYLQKTITLIELREYIRILNKFFILRYSDHGECKCKKFEEDLKIPKLEIKGDKQQKIAAEESSFKIVNSKAQQMSQKLVKYQYREEGSKTSEGEPIKEQKHEGKDLIPVTEPIKQQKAEEKKDIDLFEDETVKYAKQTKKKIGDEKKQYILVYEECFSKFEDFELVAQQKIKLEY